MQKRPSRAQGWRWSCAAAALSLAAPLALSLAAAAQQPPLPDLFAPEAAVKKHEKKPADTPGPHPSAEISLQQLGFAPPASFYLGDRLVQTSLNFLDEDRLLFTFRVPGLIARDHQSSEIPSGGMTTEERNIRAVVLSLPSGKVEAEALWRLHDFAAYLWMMPGGRFLLRDRNLVQIGDASLHLEPFLRFPGIVKYLELDPEQKMLVTQNVERLQESENEGGRSSIAGDIASNSSPNRGSDASVIPLPGPPTRKLETASYLRVFRMNDRKILITIHVADGIVHVPVDGYGYYDATRGRGSGWQIAYHDFDGAENRVSQIESICTPPLDPIAPGVVLASACTETGGRRLVVLTRDGRRLWETQTPATRVWPLLVPSANGLRVARATLDISHPITAGSPLDTTDIHTQTIQVFDTATGRVAITGPASPPLDGGGNFALSPSGNRFAVLNAGSIQVYDLPPAPPLPAIPTTTP
jgi:hypothetical protein